MFEKHFKQCFWLPLYNFWLCYHKAEWKKKENRIYSSYAKSFLAGWINVDNEKYPVMKWQELTFSTGKIET